MGPQKKKLLSLIGRPRLKVLKNHNQHSITRRIAPRSHREHFYGIGGVL